MGSGGQPATAAESQAEGPGVIDSLTIQVETKFQEDSDKDKVNVGSAQSITLTAGTITTFQAGATLDSASQGLQDLVRFKYTVKAESGKHAWVHILVMNPAWLSN